MAEMTEEQFKQKVIDVLDEVGANVASSQDIDQVEQITDNITLPGVELDSQGSVVRYVSAKMVIFKNYLNAVIAVFYGWFGHDDTEGIQKTWKDWFSDTLATGVRKIWNTWFGEAPTQESEGSGVQKEWAGLKTDAVTATNAANTAASSVHDAIDQANTAAQNANNAAGRADTSRQQIEQNESTRQSQESTRQQNESTRQSQESTRQQNESTRQSQESARETRATSDHTRAEGDHTTATGDHTTAGTDHTRAEDDHTRAEQDHSRAETDHTRADNDHDASVQATEEASNVNADLTGMTVTITDRNGVSRNVNIGFEITQDHVYPSVAAMKADAAYVLPGQFCMIATTDPTSADNAQLWTRNSSSPNSSHPFTFLSDLDQASTAAWADWMENYKPVIIADHQTAEGDHTRAESDHTRAEQDHTRAENDHSTASSDHTRAESEHTRAEQDHSTAVDDHTQAGQDHTRAENDHTTATDDHGIAELDHETAVDDHDRAETDHSRAEGDHTTATGDHTQAGQDHDRAEQDHSTASTDHTRAETDHDRADDDHDTATADHTRAEGDHSIATGDHSTAQADHTTATGDHSRAELDHSRAETDHSTAMGDHDTATSDHTTADTDHNRAEQDHSRAETDHSAAVDATAYATEQGDYAKEWNDHPPFIGNGTTGDLNYWYLYDITTEQYVKGPYAKGDNLDWDSMTQADKDRLIQELLQTLEDSGFDAVPTENSSKPVRSGGIYDAIQDEVEAREQAVSDEVSARQQAVSAEAQARQGADDALLDAITAEETRAKAAEKQNADDIDAIEALIPQQATSSNQLADKAFVNSSVATATATFRGTYNLVSDLNLTVGATELQIASALAAKMTALSITPDNNDYSFVQIPTATDKPTEIARVDRYKYNGTAWMLEYSLNNSGFNAAQWEAINSYITSELVTKLIALPTNAQLTLLLSGKQDNLTFASIATCEAIVDELT